MTGNIQRFDVSVHAPEYQVKNRSDKVRDLRTGGVVREMAVATFDPSANTSERTVAAHGLGVYIPDNAIITRVFYDVITTFTSPTSDGATIALHVQSANDILAAIAISDGTNMFDAGIHGTKIGWPNLGADAAHDSQVEVAALYAATFLKMTDEREITATVAVEALTAGKLVVYVEYVVSA